MTSIVQTSLNKNSGIFFEPLWQYLKDDVHCKTHEHHKKKIFKVSSNEGKDWGLILSDPNDECFIALE